MDVCCDGEVIDPATATQEQTGDRECSGPSAGRDCGHDSETHSGSLPHLRPWMPTSYWLLKSKELREEICCFGQRTVRPEVGVRRCSTKNDNQEEGNYAGFS